MRVKTFYYRTFAWVALLPYAGGTVAHILRLVYRFQITEAPDVVHWVVVMPGGYASLGFVLFAGKISFRGAWDKLLYALVIFHLGGSAIMHGYSLFANSNGWLGIFTMDYSYFAVAYFVGLGLYCLLLARRIGKED